MRLKSAGRSYPVFTGAIGDHIFLAKPITTDELVQSIDRALTESPEKSERKLP